MGYGAGFGVYLANAELRKAHDDAAKVFDRMVEESLSRSEAMARDCVYEPRTKTYLCPRPAGYTPLLNRGVMCAGCGASMTQGAAVCGYCRRLHGS